MAQSICAHCHRRFGRAEQLLERFLCTRCEAAWLLRLRARSRPRPRNAAAAAAGTAPHRSGVPHESA